MREVARKRGRKVFKKRKQRYTGPDDLIDLHIRIPRSDYLYLKELKKIYKISLAYFIREAVSNHKHEVKELI